MRLLLDTCIVYDWLMGTIADEQTIDRIITQGALVSPVSVWEMAIKHGQPAEQHLVLRAPDTGDARRA